MDKTILYLLIMLLGISFTGCHPQTSLSKTNTTLKFLYKTNFDTSAVNKGQHIEINQILPKTNELIRMSIDDRDIINRSGYSRSDEIIILGEYLTFSGDTVISNKRYEFKPSHWYPPSDIKGFTVQIEALYSFTRMLTEGFPPIKPMLVDCITGEELNTNLDKVKEVYEIYKNWYRENLKSDFKNISFPLSGTRFCWLGHEKGLERFLDETF